MHILQSISRQCSISVPPENDRTPYWREMGEYGFLILFSIFFFEMVFNHLYESLFVNTFHEVF